MNRLHEMLHEPSQCAYEGENLIYFTKDKTIVLTHVGEDGDLVQIEGAVDERLHEWLEGLLEL